MNWHRHNWSPWSNKEIIDGDYKVSWWTRRCSLCGLVENCDYMRIYVGKGK